MDLWYFDEMDALFVYTRPHVFTHVHTYIFATLHINTHI